MTEIRTTSSTGGQKGTKPERMDLLPPDALTLLSRIYGSASTSASSPKSTASRSSPTGRNPAAPSSKCMLRRPSGCPSYPSTSGSPMPPQADRCKLGVFLDTLNDTDRVALEHAIGHPHLVTADKLASTLRDPTAAADERLVISPTLIRYHRRRACPCYLGRTT
jgi:hypothetical protein